MTCDIREWRHATWQALRDRDKLADMLEAAESRLRESDAERLHLRNSLAIANESLAECERFKKELEAELELSKSAQKQTESRLAEVREELGQRGYALSCAKEMQIWQQQRWERERRHRKWSIEKARYTWHQFYYYMTDCKFFHEEDKTDIAELHKRLAECDEDILVLRGALGYPVPGDIGEILSNGERPKCGLCEAKDKQLAEREARIWELEVTLDSAWERMDRARSILRDPACGDDPGANWDMLDTTIDRAALRPAEPEPPK